MKTEVFVSDLPNCEADLNKFSLKLEQLEKKCEKCHLIRTPTDFYKNGQDNTCKVCRKHARNIRYRDKAPSLQSDKTDNGCHNKHHTKKNRQLLTDDEIRHLAEAFLMLESWQADIDTQRDLSNSNSIQK